MSGDEQRIPTSLRTLLLVEALVAAGRPLRLAKLGETLGLPKQTVHRLCVSLLAQDFLERDAEGRGVAPGPRLRRMAPGVLLPEARHLARHQVLERVSSAGGETCNLVIPETAGMTYVDRVETHWPIRVQLPVGTHVPFHCTASGKMYLSSLDEPARERLIATLALTRRARNTHTDVESLGRDLQAIARRGYSIDEEEMIDGMVAVAVPVREVGGRFLAALAVHGPAQRFGVEQAKNHITILETASRELSRLMMEA